MASGRTVNRLSGYAVATSVLVILGICLQPASGSAPAALQLCLLCGDVGAASFFLNILLYVPLGAAVRFRTGSLTAGVAAGLLLSLSVEITQLWIPGRFTTLGDLVANTSGAGIGALLWNHPSRWILPKGRPARLIALGWAATAAVLVSLPGWLLSPSFPEGELWVLFTPKLPALEHYGGEVISARVADIALVPPRVQEPERVRSHLASGAALRLRLRAGEGTDGLAPILRIVAPPYGSGREVLQIGADGNDLVVRPRFRADDVGLSRPDLRVRGALSEVEEGQIVDVFLQRRAAGGYDIRIDDRTDERLELSSSRGWSLLRYPAGRSERLLRTADLLWIFLLLLPLGWWAKGVGPGAALALLPVSALALVPLRSPLAAASPAEYLTLAAALVGGLALRSAVERWCRGKQWRRY